MERWSKILIVLGVLFLGNSSLAASLTKTDDGVAPWLPLRSGGRIPALALGTWLGNNTPSGDEVEKAVTWAIDAGYRHIDTAARYKVEDQVGRAVNQAFKRGVPREKLFITTKLWNNAHAKEAVVGALRRSLADLNLSYVDLYLIHWPIGQYDNGTYDQTSYLDTWRGMMEAKALGLTKHIGLSNFNTTQIEDILDAGLEVPEVLQIELNLNLQQKELRHYCKEKGIVIMGYTPLGSLLQYRVASDAPPPRIDNPQLVAMGKKYNKTVPQLVLRYLSDLGIIPIAKSLNKSRIEENLDIYNFKLTDKDKTVLAQFNANYRVLPQTKWIDNPYYPFAGELKAN